MSLTTDNVQPSPHPNSWRIGRLTVAGLVMGLGELAFCVAVFVVGDFVAGYKIETLRTLALVTLVCGNQATTYNNRESRPIWSSRPSSWLIASSVADTSIAWVLAVAGIAMAPLPLGVIASALGGAVVFAFLMDLVKVPCFAVFPSPKGGEFIRFNLTSSSMLSSTACRSRFLQRPRF